MSKNVTILISVGFFWMGVSPVEGEILVGILKKVDSNGAVVLSYRNTPVVCRSLGIRILDDLPSEAPNPQQCRERITAYYRSHPSDRTFTRDVLHANVGYHYEWVGKACVLYANGPESLSEMLLKRGLAQPEKNFDQKEWNEKLQRAFHGAQKAQVGMFGSEEIEKFCMKEEQ